MSSRRCHGETVLVKSLPNAFAGTPLADLVRATGRREIVIAGFATHMCVSATARSALDHGFRTTVVAAATATRDLPHVCGAGDHASGRDPGGHARCARRSIFRGDSGHCAVAATRGRGRPRGRESRNHAIFALTTIAGTRKATHPMPATEPSPPPAKTANRRSRAAARGRRRIASICRQVKMVASSLVRRVDQHMQPLELTGMQWEPVLMLWLKRADTVAGLARVSQMGFASMSRMLDRLEEKDLLRRERSAADRRVVHLHLTAKGTQGREQDLAHRGRRHARPPRRFQERRTRPVQRLPGSHAGEWSARCRSASNAVPRLATVSRWPRCCCSPPAARTRVGRRRRRKSA